NRGGAVGVHLLRELARDLDGLHLRGKRTREDAFNEALDPCFEVPQDADVSSPWRAVGDAPAALGHPFGFRQSYASEGRLPADRPALRGAACGAQPLAGSAWPRPLTAVGACCSVRLRRLASS